MAGSASTLTHKGHWEDSRVGSSEEAEQTQGRCRADRKRATKGRVSQ